MLYWRMGQRIHRDILGEKRADCGKRIVASLGRQVAAEFGDGFGEKNLRRMIQFAEAFPDEEIVAALRIRNGRSACTFELRPWRRALHLVLGRSDGSVGMPSLHPENQETAHYDGDNDEREYGGNDGPTPSGVKVSRDAAGALRRAAQNADD